jgi:HIRAN domain
VASKAGRVGSHQGSWRLPPYCSLQDPSFAPGQALKLVPEPTNTNDANAVGVWNSTRTLQIGYLPKETAAKLAKKSQEEMLRCLSLWEYRVKGQRVGLRILLLGERARVLQPSESLLVR